MNIVIPKPVNEVLNIINEKGYEAYIVGGAVRNWVMQLKPTNYNISTNASLDKIIALSEVPPIPIPTNIGGHEFSSAV